MKRIIFTISGMCLAGSSLYAQQDQLHFADMSAAPSAVLLWPVKLSGPAAVVGVQFDLVYAPGQVASGSARAGTGGLSLLAAAREIAPGRTRVAVSSLKNEALVKDAFLELPLSLPSTAPAGGPFYTIEHIILTLADGTKVPAGVQSGPLTEWRKRHFTPEELLEGSLTGDGADPDGDGASNLVEYAVGGDPRRALPGEKPEAEVGVLDENGQPVFFIALNYRRALNAPGVLIQPEVSTDLTGWIPGTPPVQTGAGDAISVPMQARAVVAGEIKKFLRLKITRQPQ